MDPVIYFLADHFPWWGIPLILILAETANHFRRTGRRGAFFATATLSFLMLILVILYFTQSGFVNLRPAMQEIERHYQKK